MKIFAILNILTFCTTASLCAQNSDLEDSKQRGSEIYTDFCINCHMAKGEGILGTFPPLATSDYLMNNREASIRGIKYGLSGELTVNGEIYNNVMTPMGLEDDEIADVMNYISNSWGNSLDQIVTEEEVAAVEK